MRTSAPIARQSTSTIAATAAESHWTMASWSRSRSASTGRHCVADQPSAPAPPLCSASSASSNASSSLNLWAISSRCENGSSTAREAAREKPGVPAPCDLGGEPVDGAGGCIVSACTTWRLGG